MTTYICLACWKSVICNARAKETSNGRSSKRARAVLSITRQARSGKRQSAFATIKGPAMAQAKLAQGAAHAATKAGPSVVREIVYGTTLGIFVGSFWKMYHINSRRKVQDFYAALEKGEITVEAS